MKPPESWLELPDGKSFLLKGRCAIGRQPDNELVLDLPTLSRRHAVVAADGGGYTLIDLHSRNGTYVNGAAVTRPVSLRDGDEVRLGSATLRFRCKRSWFALGAKAADPTLTERLDQVNVRDCWLLLIDAVAAGAGDASHEQEAAVRHRQAWIAELRPHIETNGGRITGYLGDAVLACWTCDATTAPQVLATLRAIELWRPRSPLGFHLIVHQGKIIFTRSDHGEELVGDEVNFLAHSRKIARAFAAPAMLSPNALKSLELEGRCESYGRSGIDGMKDFYTFYALPREWSAVR